MRKNEQNVLTAYFNGRSCNENSISTDGKSIKSYATPLLWTDKVTNHLTFNQTIYSRTTSAQQSAIRGELNARGLFYDVVDNKSRGFHID